MEYEDIILEKDNGVATIIINRPERMNALVIKTVEELVKAIEEVAQDRDIRVLVLTGKGRAFCAGGDLEGIESDIIKEKSVKLAEITRRYGMVSFGLRNLTKPTIASVNGAAVGIGLNFALACDIIIASENARFGEAFVNMGLHPDGGGTYFLPRLVGVAKACELIFTGDIIDAREAEKIGLVNKVVPQDSLESATKELAFRLAKGPPAAIGLAKVSIYQGLEMNLAQVLEREAAAQALCLATEDCKEALTAFREKRPPVFKGR